MTIWTPEIGPDDRPIYRAIARAIESDIQIGRLKEGDRLPPQRDLAWKLGVTLGTVSRAYTEAEKRGLVGGEVGRGTFVRSLDEGRGVEEMAETAVLKDLWRKRTDFSPRAMLERPPARTGDGPPGPIDLASNYPVAAGFDRTMVEILGAIAERPPSVDLSAYQPHAGVGAHRDAAAQWAALHGVPADPSRIVITHGAQNAASMAVMALVRPGDGMLVEKLTYHGIKALAAMQGARLHGVEMDEDGVTPESLDEAASRGGARVAMLVPNLQNPTAAVMPEERRRRIVDVARKHDLILVEDDIYGFLLDDAPPPFAALAPERSIYLTSLSKAVAPGLRFGFLQAPNRSLFDRICAAVRASLYMSAPYMGEVAARLIGSGMAQELAANQRREAVRRQTLAAPLLDGFDYRSHPASFHIWLHLPEPWRSSDLVEAARDRGVLLRPAGAFAVNRSDAVHMMRLCLTGERDLDRLAEGLDSVASILRHHDADALSIV